MADPRKWHSMQKLSIKPEKLDQSFGNSILDSLKNDSDVKSEVTAAETVELVSLSSQPTQIVSVSIDATKCFMENLRSSHSSETSISGSDSTGNLQATSLENLPTQSYEHNWKKKLLDRDLNENLATSDFPRSEISCGKKRKINVSPAATRPWENEEYCKRIKICGPNEAESIWRKSSQREGEKSQGHDFVTLDHSYSSGQKKNAQKFPPFSEIAGKLTKRRENKENEENRFCPKDEQDVIILDEFTSLGEKIVLSPIILSPAKKVESPGHVATVASKSATKNSAKCLHFYGNLSRMETASKLRDLTNFVGPKTSETPDESEAINCPANSSPRPASMRRFLNVDSFSNGCCEYDRDLKEISESYASANYFHNLELMSKNNLKIDKNAEEFEMREKVDEILKFLQNEPL